MLRRIKLSSSQKSKGLGMGKHPLPTQTGATPGTKQKLRDRITDMALMIFLPLPELCLDLRAEAEMV